MSKEYGRVTQGMAWNVIGIIIGALWISTAFADGGIKEVVCVAVSLSFAVASCILLDSLINRLPKK